MDAIWLHYDEAAAKMGHVSLLMQDDDEVWWFFYWGSNGENFFEKIDPQGSEPFCQLTELKSMEIEDVDDIKTLLGGKLADGLSDFLYFEGDFYKSLISSISLNLAVVVDENKERYNLYTNNCMQVVIDLLKKGDFGEYNSYYQSALDRASKITVPNIAFKCMNYFNETIRPYASAPWFLKPFMPKPYEKFNLIDCTVSLGISFALTKFLSPMF